MKRKNKIALIICMIAVFGHSFAQTYELKTNATYYYAKKVWTAPQDKFDNSDQVAYFIKGDNTLDKVYQINACGGGPYYVSKIECKDNCAFGTGKQTWTDGCSINYRYEWVHPDSPSVKIKVHLLLDRDHVNGTQTYCNFGLRFDYTCKKVDQRSAPTEQKYFMNNPNDNSFKKCSYNIQHNNSGTDTLLYAYFAFRIIKNNTTDVGGGKIFMNKEGNISGNTTFVADGKTFNVNITNNPRRLEFVFPN